VELNTGRSVIRGTLVDETARTIVIRTDDGSLGRKLIGLPAERLKRAMRYGWTRSV